MKIIVLGATGMLGHRLLSTLSEKHEVWGTMKSVKPIKFDIPNVDKEKIIGNIDVKCFGDVEECISEIKPEVVINCISIIKQVKLAKNHQESIYINSLFPHILAQCCVDNKCKMITFSTDCVFDGQKGYYDEIDLPNCIDLYGKTKHLGEVDYLENVITVRTSMIGRELVPKGSLLDWFLQQYGKSINGFTKSIFSGFPTYTIAKIVDKYLLDSNMKGLYHIASKPISKYDLLMLIKDLYDIDIVIHVEDQTCIDRSLDPLRFSKATGYIAPLWSELIKDLKVDDDFYQNIRKTQ